MAVLDHRNGAASQRCATPGASRREDRAYANPGIRDAYHEASTIAFSLMAFGGVGSAAYDSTRNPLPFSTSSMSFTDDVVMSSPNNVFVLRLANTNFPFQRNGLG